MQRVLDFAALLLLRLQLPLELANLVAQARDLPAQRSRWPRVAVAAVLLLMLLVCAWGMGRGGGAGGGSDLVRRTGGGTRRVRLVREEGRDVSG